MIDSEAFVKMVRDTGFEPVNPTMGIRSCLQMFFFVHNAISYEKYEQPRIGLDKGAVCHYVCH